MYYLYYKWSQKIRHLFGVHQKQKHYSVAPRCDWCGYRSPEQKMIAASNWERMQNMVESGPYNG